MPPPENSFSLRRFLKDPRKVTITEVMIWMTAVAAVMANREWLGESFLPVVFYGTIVLVSWRLCLIIRPLMAVIIAVVLAFVLATVFVYFELVPDL